MNDAPQESDQDLILLFVPPLLALLQRAEDLKGTPLSESEVLRIRDGGVCIAVRSSVAAEMEAARGYADLDAENVWHEWQNFRAQNAE